MAIKMEALSSFLLVSLLITGLLAQSRLANAQLSPGGLFPPETARDVLQCWSSLSDINGCVMGIFQSVFTLQFGKIDADCCKAFDDIEDGCFPKMFPLTPFFPPLLKNICALQGNNPPSHE